MAPRQYINAPSVEEVRKQGQHQMILSAISKKQTFADLINQANSMVTSVLHDTLKRSFNVLPSQCKFGVCQAGMAYEMTVTLKNEDSLAQRITIKPTQDKRVIVQQVEYGPIAPGMIRKIVIGIRTQPDEEVVIKEEIQILTKHDIFKIPVEANILLEEKFREVEEENKKLGKRVLNSRVRDRLNSSIKDGQYINENRDEVDQMIEGTGVEAKRHWIETTGSESKLPKLPFIEKRLFEIDPKKPLKDIVKK